MFKKLRRFFLKRLLEKKLLRRLQTLKLLEKDQQAKFIVDNEDAFGINFHLENEKQSFAKVHFSDSGQDKMTVTVTMEDVEDYVTIKFFISIFLTIFMTFLVVRKKGGGVYLLLEMNTL